MQNEVMFAGFGGQGIMLIGKMLAKAGLKAGLDVAWIPSYGPEMRGGTAYCTVVVSDRPIGSPIIVHPTNLVAMNRPSLEKFAPKVKKGGCILVNSSLIPIESGRDDVDEIHVPCNEIAIASGSAKAANVVALGAFVARTGICDWELIEDAVKANFAAKPKLVPMNMDCLSKGAESARAQ